LFNFVVYCAFQPVVALIITYLLTYCSCGCNTKPWPTRWIWNWLWFEHRFKSAHAL